MSTTAEKQFSRRLGKVLRDLSAPLSTGGFMDVKDQPTITLKKSNETYTIVPTPEDEEGSREEVRTKRLNRQVEALKGLTTQIPQAPFGHGQETKYDNSVRNAKQLLADEFDTNIPSDVLDEITREIQNDLALETDIVLEPYSLNIYETKGHFVEHKDTPRGKDMIGTLVICLPSLFQGGVLLVSTGTDKYYEPYFGEIWSELHDLPERRMAFLGSWWGKVWGGKCGLQEDAIEFNPKSIAWSAFFADAKHMIHEVEGGVRVTLAYSIRRKDASDCPEQLPSQLKPDKQRGIIEQEIQKAFNSEDFLPNGGRIGSPCFHLYTSTDSFVAQSRSVPRTADQIKLLKGKDLMIANAAAAHGLKIYLAPYLSMDRDAQGDFGDLPLSKMPQKESCPEYMSQTDVESFFGGSYGGKHGMSDEAMPWKHANVWALDYGNEDQVKERFGGTEYSYEGYFGNEAWDTAFYVQCVLFIDVPPYTDRASKNEKEASEDAMSINRKRRISDTNDKSSS